MKKTKEKYEILPDRQIKALIQLLTDEDTQVAEAIQAQILALGEQARPYLEEALFHPNKTIRNSAQILLLRMRSEKVFRQFQGFSESDVDLEEGAFLIAQSADPDLDITPYQRQLDEMAAELGKRLSEKTTPESIVHHLSHYLFAELGFQGNSTDYINPDNSYINRVLDRKLGIPISLSAIYLFIARRLDLPIAGVGMPGHFITAYRTRKKTILIDPFNAGQVLTRKACMQFITRSGQAWHDGYLAPTPDRQILARMIRNLISSYSRLGETEKAKKMEQYIACLIG